MADLALPTLRPGGGKSNPFAKFGKGAGFGVKKGGEVLEALSSKKKNPEDIIRYDRDFLVKFSEVYLKLPVELENSNIDIIIDTTDPDRAAVAEIKRKLVDEVADDRDWHVKQPIAIAPDTVSARQQDSDKQWGSNFKPTPAAEGSKEGTKESGTKQEPKPSATATAPAAAAATEGAAGAKSNGPAFDPTVFIKAEDKGYKAWAPTVQTSATDKALKQIRGIINKLTPEKFERLLGQLVGLVTSMDILQGTIKILFESAVVQPTFVSVYAEACHKLAQELPSFPPPPGETQAISFKRVLLNTCQEEYEGIDGARQKLQGASAEEAEEAEVRIKQQLLGVVRLICELYKLQVVQEFIINVCISDLLGEEKKIPRDDNIEAVCEMLKLCGKQLDSGKSKPKVEGYMKRLDLLSRDKTMASRIRFMIRDIVELRRSKWVPRREAEKSKKIEEIHAEAQAELGMLPGLAGYAGLAPALPGLAAAKPAEVELFPSFKDEGSWKFADGQTDGGSALLGDWKPPEIAREAPPTAAVENSKEEVKQEAPPKPPVSEANLSDEDRDLRVTNMYQELLTNYIESETLTRCKELLVDGYGKKMLELGLKILVDTSKPKQQELLSKMLVKFVTEGILTAPDLVAALTTFTSDLDGLGPDFPYVGQVLGHLAADAAMADVSTLAELGAGACSKNCEEAKFRRQFWVEAFKRVKAVKGEDSLAGHAKDVDIDDVLAFEEEFDGTLPSGKELLAKEGLEKVVQ